MGRRARGRGGEGWRVGRVVAVSYTAERSCTLRGRIRRVDAAVNRVGVALHPEGESASDRWVSGRFH